MWDDGETERPVCGDDDQARTPRRWGRAMPCRAPNGSKKWVLRYQVGGRRRDMGLGAFPACRWPCTREAITARRLARRRGPDRAEAGAARQETGSDLQGVGGRGHRAGAGEVDQREGSLSVGAAARAVLLRLLLDRRVNEITTSDVERILRPVWHPKPETARKLHRRIRRVFEHARIRLRDAHGVVMPDNPARWDDLKALGFEAPKKLSRGPQPSLAYREMADFMAAARAAIDSSAGPGALDPYRRSHRRGPARGMERVRP